MPTTLSWLGPFVCLDGLVSLCAALHLPRSFFAFLECMDSHCGVKMWPHVGRAGKQPSSVSWTGNGAKWFMEPYTMPS